MSGDWDGLRAAAEAAEGGPWEAYDLPPVPDGHWQMIGVGVVGDEMAHRTETMFWHDAAFIAAASPDVVLGLLDRLQAAEDAVGRLTAVTDGEKIRCPVCTRWLRLRRGKFPPHYSPDRAEYPNSCPGTSAQPKTRITSALDGSQGAATGEVALGSTGESGGPQIAVQACDHPGIDHDVVWSYCRRCPKCGVCKFIGHGPLCFDCYSASGAESDHGGRGDGEGLG